jgi:hypothetical protein
MGSKLKSSGKVVTASGATDGLFAQGSREALGSYCRACAASRSGRRGRYGKNVEWVEKISDEQYRR